ncbi:unnamed protein product, partial [Musa textilis]
MAPYSHLCSILRFWFVVSIQARLRSFTRILAPLSYGDLKLIPLFSAYAARDLVL